MRVPSPSWRRFVGRAAVRGALSIAPGVGPPLLLAAGPAVGQEAASSGAEPSETCPISPARTGPDPAFTAAEICATIAILADDSLEGREAGRPGAAKAARYLAGRFEAIGLVAPPGGHLQRFTFPTAVREYPHALHTEGETRDTTANIVGWVEGRDPRLRDEAVVVGAHYDHLGRGGPGSLAPGVRAIHNGADDNASGVAGVVELAERLAADPAPRTVVFVLFGGEELGTLGSQHYVQEPLWPLDRTVAMVNLDMIGRLRERLTIYGTGTSSAWPPIVKRLPPGEEWTIQTVPDGFGPSDHSSFYGAGIPVLMFFTGTHEAYHRPEDDLATIDAAGELEVLQRVERAIRAAADGRPIPYTEAPTTQPRAMTFQVGLGVVPDYGFVGPGLRLSSVRPGGPADAAGLAAGDVLIHLAGREVGNIYGYTAILAELEAEVPVPVTYVREGRKIETTVKPAAR